MERNTVLPLYKYNWYAVTAWESVAMVVGMGEAAEEGLEGIVIVAAASARLQFRGRILSALAPLALALLSHSDMQPSRPRRRPSLVCRPALESKQ